MESNRSDGGMGSIGPIDIDMLGQVKLVSYDIRIVL